MTGLLTDNNMQPKHRSNIPSLVCAFMASLTTGGTTYAFGLYGDALKKSLHFSQGQLDTISTAFFFAGLLSWIPGLCADRFGTRFSLSLGGVTGACATTTYWVVSRQFVALPHSWLVSILSVLGVTIFLSCALVTGSVFKIIVASCGPGTKGSAVGIAKGYVGLGSGAYACLFESIRSRGESTLDFLPMAAFFFLTCATLPALMLLPTKEQVACDTIQDEATPLHFRTLFLSLIALGVLVVGSSISELFHGNVELANKSESPHYATAFLIVTIWLGPILSLLYLPRRRPEDHEVLALEDNDVEETRELKVGADDFDESERSQTREDPLSHSSSMAELGENSSSSNELEANGDDKKATDDEEDRNLLNSEEVVDHPEADEQEEENLNLVQMLQTPSALLMLWTTTILVGAGTVETNNMGQMVESLGFTDTVTPATLALFSVAQAAGRVMTGAVSEAALNWNTRSCFIDIGVPRPFFLVVASLVGFVAHITLALSTNQIPFVFGTALSGAAFGMSWPLMVLIVGEIFGTAHVGANYMFYDGFTSAVGTLLLSKIVAGDVYEDHIDAHAEDKFTCYGSACFRETHMIVAVLSLTCVGTSLTMLYTSRHVYNKSSLHTAA